MRRLGLGASGLAVVLIIGLSLPAGAAEPPELGWATGAGGPGQDDSHGIAIDPFGNLFTTGFTVGGGDFDPGPGTLVLDGYGAFVSKQDGDGDLLWAFTINGVIFEDSTMAEAIATDSDGNVFVTGSIVGTVDFDPSPAVYELSAHDTNSDAFLAKYDGSGGLLWARVWGGAVSGGVSSGPQGLAVDSDGNAVVTGHFRQTVDLDPDPVDELIVSSVNDSQDAFVSKFDPSGDLSWAVTIGGTSSDRPEDVGVDDQGNIYSSGFFDGSADFDPDPLDTTMLTSAGLTDADSFIWKLDPTGDFVWAHSYGSTFDEDDANAMAVDADGNVYAAAQLRSVIDFDPGPGVIEAGLPAIFRASYVWKVDSNGQTQWAAAVNNDGESGVSEPHAVAVDSQGVYVTGVADSALDFDPGLGEFWVPATSNDIYVWGLDLDGNLDYAVATGGEDIERVDGLGVVARAGVAYITGFYGFPIDMSDAVIDFDPDPVDEHLLTSQGHHDVFVWSLVSSQSESDADGDGTADSGDNCPDAPNPDQADFDGDGLGDLCDPDIDDDGIGNDVDPDDQNISNLTFDDEAGTFGTIVQSGLDWEIVSADNGVSISVSGSPAADATFRVCTDDYEITLHDGDSVVVTCGSLTITVVSGSAVVSPGGGVVVTVGQGATAFVDLNADGSFHVENAGQTGDVIVTEGGQTVVLGPGESNDFAVAPGAIKDLAIVTLGSYLPTGDKKDDKTLGKAIDSLVKSRTPQWWIDDSTLDPKNGTKVFNEEKQAVAELLKVRTVEVTPIIDDLVAADAGLARLHIARAEAAIAEAVSGGAAPKKITKAQKELAKALAELVEADQEIETDRSDKAIAAYGKAWDHAQKALEALD